MFEILLYATKTFVIKKYSILHSNFDNLVTCFLIFIVLSLKYYALNLDLGFVDAIVKLTGKVI